MFEDLFKRTCTRSCEETKRILPGLLQELLSQKTAREHAKAPDSMFPGSPQDFVTRKCIQDSSKNVTRSSWKYLPLLGQIFQDID